MAATITFRPDEETRRALDKLTADGTPTSRVVRDALLEKAARDVKAQLRAEVEELSNDPQDREEVAQVLKDMEQLRAW